jgi:hypothetical protein
MVHRRAKRIKAERRANEERSKGEIKRTQTASPPPPYLFFGGLAD